MALVLPNSMDEVVYFTNRKIGSGSVRAWVYRAACPKCKEGTMGKPVEKGKVKTRSNVYACSKCGYEEEKNVHEEKLTLQAIYTCPHCGFKGEAETSYQRKNFEGVPAYVFACGRCGKKIGITKKMKNPKKGLGTEDLDDE